MNVSDIAAQLLTHFSPEERSIPDSVTYPGRNAAVIGAMNGALQEVFGKGSPWVRFAERGAILHAPATVGIVVTEDSTDATIEAADWEDWMGGCEIQIAGSDVRNRITNSERNVVLKFPHDGESSAVAVPNVVSVSGTLTSDGSTTVVFEDMPYVADFGGKPAYSSVTVPPVSGTYYNCVWVTDEWVLTKYTNLSAVAIWRSSSDVATPDLASDWTPDSPATGDPVVEIFDIYTPTSATVYHTSVDLAADVLAVHGPVKFNGLRVEPMPDGGTVEIINSDFGYTRVRSGSLEDMPLTYRVETWNPDSNSAPRVRLVLSHYPQAKAFLEYRAMICPLVVESLSSTATLPIPFQFIDSVFYPIARKRLAGCPFFRSGATAQEIADSYAEARALLKSLNPRKSSGLTTRPTH